MEQHEGHVHLDETEASGGSKEGVVRYVLMGGLLLAIILLSVVWIIPALMDGGEVYTPPADDAGVAEVETGNATDLGDDTVATETDQTTEQDGLEVIEN